MERPVIRRRRRPWFGLAILLSLVVLATAVISLNVSGICWKTRQFLTDQDAIRAAIEDGILRSQSANVNSEDVPQLPYRDAAEFLALNPACCSTTDMSSSEGRRPPPSLTDRAFGFVSRIVNVRYLQRYLDAAGEIASRPAQRFFRVTACGGVH